MKCVECTVAYRSHAEGVEVTILPHNIVKPDTRRCKCGCRRTDADVQGYWRGHWWFASQQCYAAFRGRMHAKNALPEQPEVDEQVRVGRYTLNREVLRRAHALEGTERQRTEMLLARYTPCNDSPESERAMRFVVDCESQEARA